MAPQPHPTPNTPYEITADWIWNNYREDILPSEATEEEIQRAFYAGMLAVMHLLEALADVDDDDPLEEKQPDYLNKFHTELETWLNNQYAVQ